LLVTIPEPIIRLNSEKNKKKKSATSPKRKIKADSKKKINAYDFCSLNSVVVTVDEEVE
jgi:hypothetical protein